MTQGQRGGTSTALVIFFLSAISPVICTADCSPLTWRIYATQCTHYYAHQHTHTHTQQYYMISYLHYISEHILYICCIFNDVFRADQIFIQMVGGERCSLHLARYVHQFLPRILMPEFYIQHPLRFSFCNSESYLFYEKCCNIEYTCICIYMYIYISCHVVIVRSI